MSIFASLIKRKHNELKIFTIQFIKFCIVGVMNVFINLLIYYVLIYFGTSPYIANTAGYIGGLINAYIWNAKWIFPMQNIDKRITLLKFFVVYFLSYIVSMGIMYVGIDLLYISKKIVPIINLVITTPLNFLLNKFWSFKGKKA